MKLAVLVLLCAAAATADRSLQQQLGSRISAARDSRGGGAPSAAPSPQPDAAQNGTRLGGALGGKLGSDLPGLEIGCFFDIDGTVRPAVDNQKNDCNTGTHRCGFGVAEKMMSDPQAKVEYCLKNHIGGFVSFESHKDIKNFLFGTLPGDLKNKYGKTWFIRGYNDSYTKQYPANHGVNGKAEMIQSIMNEAYQVDKKNLVKCATFLDDCPCNIKNLNDFPVYKHNDGAKTTATVYSAQVASFENGFTADEYNSLVKTRTNKCG